MKNFSTFIKESTDIKLTLYHGTESNFEYFDLKHFNAGSSDGGWLGYGVYLTNDYEYAKSYGNVLECEVTLKNPYILTDHKYSTSPQRLNNELETFNSFKTTQKLKELGYDSVMLRYDDSEFNGLEDFIEVCVFNPENIKIINNMKNFENFILEYKQDDEDLNTLKNIAKKFDNAFDFDDHLNRNKYGHNRELCFLGERFSRLNRGNRLYGSEKIPIYRTGDENIKWGDYIYIDYEDAFGAFSAGQGKKIYKKIVPINDIVETSVAGEFYYSPKNIAKIGNDLVDFWNYANNITTKVIIDKENIKERTKNFKKELKLLTGVYSDFDEFEEEVFKLSKKFNVPLEDYEKYF